MRSKNAWPRSRQDARLLTQQVKGIGIEDQRSAQLLMELQDKLAGMMGLKRYLLMNRQDQFTRALVDKLTAYALGRSLSFGDNADIDHLTITFRKQGDRLADLVHLITQSTIFNSK